MLHFCMKQVLDRLLSSRVRSVQAILEQGRAESSQRGSLAGSLFKDVLYIVQVQYGPQLITLFFF